MATSKEDTIKLFQHFPYNLKHPIKGYVITYLTVKIT